MTEKLGKQVFGPTGSGRPELTVKVRKCEKGGKEREESREKGIVRTIVLCVCNL